MNRNIQGPKADRWGAAVTEARILLVEDDELNQRLVRAVLTRSADPRLSSAELLAAATLAEARAALAGGGIDVVLLDMQLPDGDGLSLAAEIRDAPGGDPPRVLALSGAAAGHQGAARAAGCVAVLAKPYDAASLRGLISAALQPASPAPGAPGRDESDSEDSRDD
jgi:two-component system, OmpR family, KDP operon response regulator KdpE